MRSNNASVLSFMHVLGQNNLCYEAGQWANLSEYYKQMMVAFYYEDVWNIGVKFLVRADNCVIYFFGTCFQVAISLWFFSDKSTEVLFFYFPSLTSL